MRFIVLFFWLFTLLCHSGIGYPLKAREIKTITNHVTTRFNGIELELSVVTKKDAGIRVTVFSPSQKHAALILFDEKEVYLSKRSGIDTKAYTKLSGQEAAENLFQMLALNPWIHFPDGKLKYNSPALEDYRIVFDYILKDKNVKPTGMRLYEMAPAKDKLISTIRFVEFFSQNINLFQPKTLLVLDQVNQRSGEVHIKNYNYNQGLGDFLFNVHRASETALTGP